MGKEGRLGGYEADKGSGFWVQSGRRPEKRSF